MDQEQEYQKQRELMVTHQIERRGLYNKRLLNAMRSVPRHDFVPPRDQSRAYDDGPLPIGNSQTISQPYIVALMTSLLTLEGKESVLEVGTGSGYQAAILAKMAAVVHTVERIPELAESARRVLQELEIQNVHVHSGDGSLGWQKAAPYQAIMVTAAAPKVPEPLLQQLDQGGKLVVPVGPRWGQNLEVWERNEDNFDRRNLIPVSFVPLRGAHGWHDNEW
jgi:protein-L-isoaspartate(D-aspartate) O-methyltransferase